MDLALDRSLEGVLLWTVVGGLALWTIQLVLPRRLWRRR
jgi:hypothetical protein